jgi:5-oxoprolinase (ATP-hydrolysing) subunit A
VPISAFPDLLGFGHRRIDVVPFDPVTMSSTSWAPFAVLCRATAVELHHVKLHGAFYIMALDDAKLARAVAEAVAVFEAGLLIYPLAGSEM